MSEGTDMLKERYDLHKAPEVDAAAKRTLARKGEKVPQAPEAQIQNYLDRFKEIIERPDPNLRERGIEAIKRVLLDKFVTKFEEIPDSFWQSQERILRERGQQADYNRFSEEQKAKWKKEIAEGLLDDQQASLEQWIDYLASGDSSYMPDYMKYWVFRSVTNLQEYDKEKQEFPKRSKGTVKMFPDINHEALSYVIDAVIKKHQGEGFSFEQFNWDLTDEAKQDFKNYLQQENFAKLYAWANELIQPISKHQLLTTEGRWIKYNQGSSHLPLVESIRGRGTGWCTAGESTAKTQLASGDFYVYYSNDDDGKATNPRIAIRMEGNRIAEIRGIGFKQNLDPYMGDVLEKKLDEFPDKELYLKTDRDMKYLTEIDSKVQKGEALTKEDLVFLYEIDSKIDYFGYEKDPRIEELRQKRNPDEDMFVVFECAPDQIAHNIKEVREDTRAYVGPLEPGILNLLPPNIEHIYTSFPGGKIRRFSLEIGGRSLKDLQRGLERGGSQVSSDAQDMLKSNEFTTLEKPEEIDLVRLSVSDLGFSDFATIDELYKRAQELGLELVPAEVGPHLRLVLKDQPMGEWLYIGMKHIPDRYGSPSVFALARSRDGSWLRKSWADHSHAWDLSNWADPSNNWRPDDEFVFALRK